MTTGPVWLIIELAGPVLLRPWGVAPNPTNFYPLLTAFVVNVLLCLAKLTRVKVSPAFSKAAGSGTESHGLALDLKHLRSAFLPGVNLRRMRKEGTLFAREKASPGNRRRPAASHLASAFCLLRGPRASPTRYIWGASKKVYNPVFSVKYISF